MFVRHHLGVLFPGNHTILCLVGPIHFFDYEERISNLYLLFGDLCGIRTWGSMKADGVNRTLFLKFGCEAIGSSGKLAQY